MKKTKKATLQAKDSFQTGKGNAVEGKSISYKSKGKPSVEKKPLPCRTQELLTRFHTLNLHDSFATVSSHVSPSDDVINHRCSCGNVGALERIQSASSESSHSDCDDDEEEDNSLTVQQILSMLIAAEVKGHISPSRASVLKNLANSCNAEEQVSDVYLRQFLKLISSQLDVVVGISVQVLAHLAGSTGNCERILRMNIVQIALHLIEYNQSDTITENLFQLLKEILKHKDLKDAWLEVMITSGLPMLMIYVTKKSLDLLHSEEVSPGVEAVSSLLSECAAYQELAVLMLDQFVPQLTSLAHMNPALQEPVLMLMHNIASHNDFTNSALLCNKRLLQQTAHTLAKGSCSVQKAAIALYTQLTATEDGLSHFLSKEEEDLYMKTFFSVMKATHCRKVCHEGCKFLLQILNDINNHQWEELLSLCHGALGDQTQVESSVSKKSTRDGKSSSLSARNFEGRHESALEEFCKLMMQVFYTEGKFDIANKEIKAVRFKPGMDSCVTLHLITQCFTRVVHHVTNSARSSNKVKKEAARVTYDENILTIIQSNVLHVITLLNSFSVFQNFSSTQLPRGPQKNIETMYLQASLKVWQSQSATNLFQLTLSSEEKDFVKDLLELCFCLSCLSCVMWNADFRPPREESIFSTEEISSKDKGGQTPNLEHHFVENIADAFRPSKVERSEVCRDSEGAKCGAGGGKRHGKKLAWGSDPLTKEGPEGKEGHLETGWREEGLLLSDVKQGEEDEGDIESTEKERTSSGFGSNRKGRSIRSRRRGNLEEDTLDKMGGDVLIDEKGDGKNEMSKFQKTLRKKLIKGGLVEAVCPWVSCEDGEIQLLALSVLHCLVLPWYPEEIQNYCRSVESKRGLLGTQQIRVQQMAESLAERDKLLSEVLQQVSSQTAGVITDALAGQRSSSSSSKLSKKRTAQDTSGTPCSPCGGNITISKDEPVSFQVALWCLEILGPRISLVLRQTSGDALKECLFMVHDLATFGEVTIHLKLASVGVLSALIEVSTELCQEEQITLIALKTLRVLVQDLRMKQLFLGEGGHIFLEQLGKSSARPTIRQEVTSLLSSVSHGTAPFAKM